MGAAVGASGGNMWVRAAAFALALACAGDAAAASDAPEALSPGQVRFMGERLSLGGLTVPELDAGACSAAQEASGRAKAALIAALASGDVIVKREPAADPGASMRQARIYVGGRPLAEVLDEDPDYSAWLSRAASDWCPPVPEQREGVEIGALPPVQLRPSRELSPADVPLNPIVTRPAVEPAASEGWRAELSEGASRLRGDLWLDLLGLALTLAVVARAGLLNPMRVADALFARDRLLDFTGDRLSAESAPFERRLRGVIAAYGLFAFYAVASQLLGIGMTGSLFLLADAVLLTVLAAFVLGLMAALSWRAERAISGGASAFAAERDRALMVHGLRYGTMAWSAVALPLVSFAPLLAQMAARHLPPLG